VACREATAAARESTRMSPTRWAFVASLSALSCREESHVKPADEPPCSP
jgi:hypothetical protein